MKSFKYLFFLLLLLLVCTACTEPESQKKIENKPVKSTQPAKVVTKPTVVKVSMKEIKKVNEWHDNTIQKTEYNMSQGTCKEDGLIAPAYVDEDRIIYLSYGQEEDHINEFSRDTQNCKVIYQSKGIGNITGINGKLFWSEYNTKQISNVDWKIKSLNLSNNKVVEISSGGSYKDTPTPTIKNGVDSVNWIEYDIQKNIVVSKLVQYDVITESKSIVSEVSLDESDSRQGEYFIQQQGAETKAKMLVYQTFFKKGEKSFNISIQEKGKLTKTLLAENRVLDFNSNEKYFTYTGEGQLTAFPIDDPNNKQIFKTGNKLTTDTPIFINADTLVFRYAMNELFIVNLDQQISYSITNYSDLISKPIYNNGFLSYGMKTGEEGNEKVSFFVVKIN
ncbi:hypothetical protein [Fictibacillus barbaricus]|uniref:Lipoprotein n=1 Tax=Fictibacillus barbaricus TaxID=182136 RepID=A0ABU1U3P7_9BACL|nr:hypothetical protein [Fictibacillus barbaricus]MDR7073996.1 hypothetical protein [Fictibacillus barbaricus]